MTAQSAALDALISHLQANLEGVANASPIRVLEGWPETGVLELDKGPVVVVLTAGRPSWQSITPEQISQIDTDETTTTLVYRVAQGTSTIHVVAVTAYRAKLLELEETVNGLLENLFPQSSGLILPTAYYDLPVRLNLQAVIFEGDAGMDVGEWSVTWVLSAQLDQVKVKDWPLQKGTVVTITMP